MFAVYLTTCLIGSSPVSTLQTYNPVDSGIVVEINLPREPGVGHLWLLDHDNNLLTDPVGVIGGTQDLIGRMPHIKEIRVAAWLQLVVGGEPVGAPLVVQPMTSREVPITTEETRADGKTTYTKIIGWKNETEEDGLTEPLVNGWRVYQDMDAVIETSEGEIRISLRPDVAPNTVWNFRELAMGGFYRESSFHRIVPMTSRGDPFVIQGGDPTGTGSGGPGWWLPIENSSLPHDFGVISMARAGDPDSAGSQFFLCLSRQGTARLDGQYCSFGETIEGEDVIRAISTTPLAEPSSGKPVNPPRITTIRLELPAPRTLHSQNRSKIEN
jgi:cyclophilin family peptidyl-prolyl cis-trans isomerase